MSEEIEQIEQVENSNTTETVVTKKSSSLVCPVRYFSGSGLFIQIFFCVAHIRLPRIFYMGIFYFFKKIQTRTQTQDTGIVPAVIGCAAVRPTQPVLELHPLLGQYSVQPL